MSEFLAFGRTPEESLTTKFFYYHHRGTMEETLTGRHEGFFRCARMMKKIIFSTQQKKSSHGPVRVSSVVRQTARQVKPFGIGDSLNHQF